MKNTALLKGKFFGLVNQSGGENDFNESLEQMGITNKKDRKFVISRIKKLLLMNSKKKKKIFKSDSECSRTEESSENDSSEPNPMEQKRKKKKKEKKARKKRKWESTFAVTF